MSGFSYGVDWLGKIDIANIVVSKIGSKFTLSVFLLFASILICFFYSETCQYLFFFLINFSANFSFDNTLYKTFHKLLSQNDVIHLLAYR